jgi:hypothetical protein
MADNLPSWATIVDDPAKEEEVQQLPEWATVVEPPQLEALPEWATIVEEDVVAEPVNEEDMAYIPPGVEAGSYSQETIPEDDRLYQPIVEFMELRYGLQAIEGKSKDEIVNRFLNNRRGNAMGNTIRALSEADFLYGIKDDPEQMAKVGRAYGIYENMAGLFDEGTTGWEKAEIVMDSAREIILDPINLAGGIIGKAVGGTATRVGVKTLNKMATKAAMAELTKQAGKAGAKAAARKVYKAATVAAQKVAAGEMTEYAAKLAATKGFNRVMTRAGIKEVAAATAVDAIAGTGTEWLYQRSLAETGVQEGINPYAVGLAALSGLALGGIQATRVAARGRSNTALVSEVVKQGDPSVVARELQESITEYMTSGKLDETSSWASKVEGGQELAAKDTDFFVELLLGRNATGTEVPTIKQPKVRVSNPGGEWLANKQARAAEARAAAEPGTYNANLGNGATTGTISATALDPKALADIAGSMGEEAFRETGEKLSRLEASIAKEGYTPSPILVHVREDGVPFVVEGNHRLAEAIKSGRESIDVEIQYRNGAEEADGLLKPGNLPVAKSAAEEGPKEGDVLFKGLAQIMQENGFFFAKRDPDDKVSNWVADFIKSMDDKDARAIVKAYSDHSGNKIKGLGRVTAESLGDLFANKMNQGARTLNSAKQVADRLEVDIGDLDIEMYLRDAMGMNMMETPPSKFNEWGEGVGAGVRKAQNNMIRSLVSHPSTSMLNVVGYASASAMGSASDLTQALLYATRGTLEGLVGMSEKGASHKRMAAALAKANANRVRLLLDSDMTQEAFKSALLRNSGPMEKLSRVQSGGVEITNGIEEMAKMGKTQRKFWQGVEGGVDVAQAATFVDAQDIYTKSQEYVFQMDKNLRVAFGKGWNEFYNSADAQKIMATKQYKQLETTAVDQTLEKTFSKSYKGKKALGEFAGFIEDARNIPGLGALVPFGKFFNNTIDFMVKNSPAGLAAKVAGMGYKDVPIQELVARSAVAGGVVLAFSAGEDEKRRQGLGLYEVIDPATGEVRSKQYDYPLSLFQAAGRIMAYRRADEEVPDEIAEQIIRDFFGGSLTRNVAKSGDVMVDAVAALVKGELEEAGGYAQQSVGAIGSQVVSSYTRSLEPLGVAVGLAFPDRVERAPELNTSTGLKKQLKDSMRYVENFGDLITGKGSQVLKQSASEGAMDPQSTKALGTRTETHTDTLRIMHMLGFEGWQLNAAYRISRATPEVANKYQKNFFEIMEQEAAKMMDNTAFRSLNTKQQRLMWEKTVKEIKGVAKQSLLFNEDANSTSFEQYDLTEKYSADSIKTAMEDLELEGDLFELNHMELILIDGHLEIQSTIDEMSIPDEAYSY